MVISNLNYPGLIRLTGKVETILFFRIDAKITKKALPLRPLGLYSQGYGRELVLFYIVRIPDYFLKKFASACLFKK